MPRPFATPSARSEREESAQADPVDVPGTDATGRRAAFSDNRDRLKVQDLRGCDLSGGAFCTADFSGADLTGADLSLSSFSRCSFAGATLARVDLRGCRFVECDFRGAELTACRGEESAFFGCLMSRLRAESARLDAVHLERCQLHDADFRHAHLISARLNAIDVGCDDPFVHSDLRRAVVHAPLGGETLRRIQRRRLCRRGLAVCLITILILACAAGLTVQMLGLEEASRIALTHQPWLMGGVLLSFAALHEVLSSRPRVLRQRPPR